MKLSTPLIIVDSVAYWISFLVESFFQNGGIEEHRHQCKDGKDTHEAGDLHISHNVQEVITSYTRASRKIHQNGCCGRHRCIFL